MAQSQTKRLRTTHFSLGTQPNNINNKVEESEEYLKQLKTLYIENLERPKVRRQSDTTLKLSVKKYLLIPKIDTV